MHLVDLLALRPVPAAGISFGLTRRCPLHCEHCATGSTMASEEGDAEMFRRFVGTFRADDHPQLAAYSGGEAFLRPELLRELAEQARTVGTASMALSGMYWARGRRIPPAIKRAIDSLDHFSASLDVFHEKEVPRADVFRALGTLLAEGKDVSIQLVGLDARDPYLADATADIRRTFGDRVPVLVNDVSAFGRAEDWMQRPLEIRPRHISPDPCALAAWPVVSYDGTVVACGNEDVVSGGRPPAHLRLGHASTDSWTDIRSRSVGTGVLRAIRTYGPRYAADRAGATGLSCSGECSTCMNLEHDPELLGRIDDLMARPSSRVVEDHVRSMHVEAGPETFTRIYGLAAYAELVTLGAS